MRTSWLAVRSDRTIHIADGSNSSQLYRSQFPSPVLFLAYNGRDNVDMQPCDLLSTLPSTKVSEETWLCAVLCPEAFRLRLNLIIFFSLLIQILPLS